MNTRLFSAVAACAGLVLTSCDKPDFSPSPSPAKETQASPPPAASPANTVPVSEPTEAEKRLASQVQELEARELALQQQLEDERLAAADAEIAKERELLQKEREAYALEQQLADANASQPAAPEPVVPPDDSGGVPLTNDYQTFYNDLDPLGSWYQSPDYGYVFQPSIAISDVNWRPYTRGRWACADQGYTWCSDEPFGWACYHYGRWVKVKHRGWLWVPGDQWAPAWVCWRKTNDYIGWCPLPPETVYDRDFTYGSTVDTDCGINPGCYVFMPVRYFDQPAFSHCEVPSVCLNIYGTSVNITNLIIRRHRVECNGPQFDWITSCLHHPMPRYALVCESNRFDHRRSPLIEKDRLHIFAPKVYAPWNISLHPARTKESLAGAEVVRADGGAPAKLLSRYRQEWVQRGKDAENLKGAVGSKIMEHQKRLADLEKSREDLRQQDRADGDRKNPNRTSSGREIAGRSGRQTGGDAVTPPDSKDPKNPGTRTGGPSAKVPENPRLAAAREQIAKLQEEQGALQPKIRKENTAPVVPNPAEASAGDEQKRLAEARAELNARKEQLAKLRADREAANKSRVQPATVVPNNKTKESLAEAAARSRDEAARKEQVSQADRTQEQLDRQNALLEKQRRDTDAANRALEKQTADRAALDQKRREQQDAQNKATKEQLAQQRAELEQQRSAADTASREAERQKTERAALEQQRRQQQETANAQEKARIAQERAVLEQQRRMAEEQAKAQRQAQEQAAAQQREALQRQAQEQAAAQQREAQQRQAQEQAARQQAVENQRRQAEEQNRQEAIRRQAEERAQEQQRRQAEEASRRQAEEQNRRQAEEQSRRQAEESRRQAEQHAKDAADRDSKKGGR